MTSVQASAGLYRYAVGFRRTLDHLRAWPIKLPSQIKSTTLIIDSDNAEHSGLKVFMFQHVPQLKYQNPDISFNIVHNEPLQCSVQFTDETGQLIKEINALNNEPNDIRKEIEIFVQNNNSL